MTFKLGSGASSIDRIQYRDNAFGLISERGDLEHFAGASAAPSTGTIYGSLIGLKAGDSITGIILRIRTAAGGTAPTLARFGLADSTGQELVLSPDLGAAANWTLGAALFPFTAPYIVPASGGYFPNFIVVGTWGSTQPLLVNGTGGTPNPTAMLAQSGYAPLNFSWSGRTDLPAIGSPLTITTVDNAYFYMACYGTPVS
jgi:hypothetical protein